MCNRCHFVGSIGKEVVEEPVKKEKSRLLFLLDKSSSVGISSDERKEVDELIEKTPEGDQKCRMKATHGSHENAIGDTRLCRLCCKYRLNNYLPKDETPKE